MPQLFASRIQINLAGAQESSFFIDSIKAVSSTSISINAPFVPMGPSPTCQTYLQYYNRHSITVVYFVTFDSPTYDFKLLPRDTGIPIQMILFKEDNVIGVAQNVEWKESGFIGYTPGRGMEMFVKFLAGRLLLNAYV